MLTSGALSAWVIVTEKTFCLIAPLATRFTSTLIACSKRCVTGGRELWGIILTTTLLQGRTFDVPERVPFRLTHNMVDAMGVTGVDGKPRALRQTPRS